MSLLPACMWRTVCCVDGPQPCEEGGAICSLSRDSYMPCIDDTPRHRRWAAICVLSCRCTFCCLATWPVLGTVVQYRSGRGVRPATHPQVTALLGNARALESHHSSFILYRLQSRYCRRDIHSITGIPSLWHAGTLRARDLTCLAASTCSGLRQHSALGSHATKTAGGLKCLAWSIGVAKLRTYSCKFYCAAPCTTSKHYPCGTLVLPLLSRWMG